MTDVISTALPNSQTIVQRFITKVYWWMFVALLTTAGVSYYVVSSPNILRALMQSPGVLIFLMLAEVGLVIVLSAAINRLSATMATGVFFLYSALTGVTMSAIFIVYTAESIATTFLISSGTFAVTALYGQMTKRDLTSVGSLAFMGLIGIIIASVVNIFFSSSLLYTAISYAGVVVFVGLTAYDAQKIKNMAGFFADGSDEQHKGAIMGALALYLDFINLFLMLLRIFGRRR